jgi:hypothetical protein
MDVFQGRSFMDVCLDTVFLLIVVMKLLVKTYLSPKFLQYAAVYYICSLQAGK